MGIKDGLLSGGSAGGNTFFHHPRKKRADGSECAPAGAEIAINLTYKNNDFDYAYPLDGKTLSAATVLELSVDGRSMFLLEGEATGAFNVMYGINSFDILATIGADDIDGNGKFSVLLPHPTDLSTWASGVISFGNAQGNNLGTASANSTLTKITRLPDYFETIPSLKCMFKSCTALEAIECEIPGRERARSCELMFFNCKSLKKAPWFNTTGVTSFSRFFAYCSALEEIPLYDTSSATDFSSMFSECRALETIPLLDTSKGTNFDGMFNNCKVLRTIPLLDTSKGTNFTSMFNGCNALESIPHIETSKGTSFTSMFNSCTVLQTIPLLDTSKGTTFNSMFKSCTSLRSIPAIDVSNGTNFSMMFDSCGNLSEYSTLDTSKGTTFQQFMNGCRSITEIKVTSTANGTDFRYAWAKCSGLTTVPDHLSFERATTMYSTFNSCTGLITVPSFRYPECTNFTTTFIGCSKVETIGVMYTPKATSFNNTFSNCTKLQSSPLRETSTASDFSFVFSKCSSMTDYTPLDFSSATTMQQAFNGVTLSVIDYINAPRCSSYYITFNCYGLQTFGGADMTSVTNSGNLYSFISNSVTYIGPLTGLKVSITLSQCNNLTHQSLVDIIGSIAEITDGSAPVLKIGATNLAKLSASEIAVATDKGWTVQ